MKDARFTIPTPALLAKVVDLLDDVPMEDRDTKGDLYEYMLGKIATAGQNGQFRTPRHIIRLMVEMTAPDAEGRDLRSRLRHLPASWSRRASTCASITRSSSATEAAQHFHEGMFHGFDFDNTMLRIGSMNMLLHGVENPDIRYRDSLAQDHAGGTRRRYTLVLATRRSRAAWTDNRAEDCPVRRRSTALRSGAPGCSSRYAPGCLRPASPVSFTKTRRRRDR